VGGQPIRVGFGQIKRFDPREILWTRGPDRACTESKDPRFPSETILTCCSTVLQLATIGLRTCKLLAIVSASSSTWQTSTRRTSAIQRGCLACSFCPPFMDCALDLNKHVLASCANRFILPTADDGFVSLPPTGVCTLLDAHNGLKCLTLVLARCRKVNAKVSPYSKTSWKVSGSLKK